MLARMLLAAALLGIAVGTLVAAPAAADVCFGGVGGAAATANDQTIATPTLDPVTVPAPVGVAVNC